MSPVIPIIVPVGQGAIGALITDAIKKLGIRITADGWKDGEDLDRLFMLLEATYGEQMKGFKRGKLMRTLGREAEFLDIFDRMVRGPDLDTPEEKKAEHGRLVAVLARHIPDMPQQTSSEAAEVVAEVLPYLVPEALDRSGRIEYGLRELAKTVEKGFGSMDERLARMEERQSVANTRVILSSDWPQAAAEALAAASEHDSPGLAQLLDALGEGERSQTLPDLLRTRPGWMNDLSVQVWQLIAVLCDDNGLWAEAEQGWLAARDRPGADYVDCTVRAAEAAALLENADRAKALFEEARTARADHPAVALDEALGLNDREDALAAIDRIVPHNPAMARLRHIALASLHASLNDVSAARASLAEADRIGGSTMGSYRLVSGNVAIAEMVEASQPSAQRATELVADALTLEQHFLHRRRFSQAAHAREQAVGFRALVGDFRAANRLMREAADLYEGVDSAEARLTIAMHAAQLERFDLVVRLVRPEDTNARADLLRVLVRAYGDEDEQRAAAPELDALLDNEFEPVRDIAASERLLLARKVPDVGWSERAAGVLANTNPRMAVVLKAWWLEGTAAAEAAEAEFLTHSDETWALAELMRLAMRAEDWETAASRAELVLARDADWRARSEAADALLLADKTDEAKAEFSRLAASVAAPLETRSRAFWRLANLAVQAQDFGVAHGLAKRWLDVDESDLDARWMLVGTLMMLGRDSEAFTAMERWRLQPRQDQEYSIAAKLYICCAEPDAALRKVVEYADVYDSPNELMEAEVVRAAMIAASGIPAELAQRVDPARFFDRFPESSVLQRFRGTEAQELRSTLATKRTKHLSDALEHVYVIGDMPIAAIATIEDDIISVCARLADSSGSGLPLGYSHRTVDDHERALANEAFGRPALWDATSIFVAQEVLELTDVLRTAFPESRLAQSALTELAAAHRNLRYRQRAEEASHVPADDPEAAAALQHEGKTLAEAVDRAQSVLDFAHKLTPVPDVDSSNPQPEDGALDGSSLALCAVYATFGVARRLQLPIYSDDRDVRRRAHEAGIPTFGTLGVLQVLAERELITEEQRRGARVALLVNRGLGVHLSAPELVALARASDYEITAELSVAVGDAFQWRNPMVPSTVVRWLAFLYEVRRDRPEQLGQWVVGLLQAHEQVNPDVPVQQPASLLVAMALLSYEVDAAVFVRALLRALDDSRESFATTIIDEPAVDAMERLRIVLGDPKHSPLLAKTRLHQAWTLLPLEWQSHPTIRRIVS